jgi:hypothetical protein
MELGPTVVGSGDRRTKEVSKSLQPLDHWRTRGEHPEATGVSVLRRIRVVKNEDSQSPKSRGLFWIIGSRATRGRDLTHWSFGIRDI